VVYCGGLENRFRRKSDGGSNPSLSAISRRRAETDIDFVKHLTTVGIWAVVIAIIFAIAWWKGYIVRARNYWNATVEELKKCSWPTWDELKGSTIVVTVSIGLLGVFTYVVDLIFFYLVRLLTP
jgi:preprotein translocase subunit SecE